MQERLQALKSPETGEQVRAQFNATRDEIIENAWRRGFKPEEQFGISAIFKADMTAAWNHGTLTTADAFARYYSHFTRDQNYFEASLGKLQTPVKIVWGARDIYIDTAMGVEFAARADSKISILPGIGHYPHLQNPRETAAEIRSAIADAGDNDAVVVNGLPAGPHKILIELATPEHKVLTGKSVTFVVPASKSETSDKPLHDH